jgi:hypothetical protein
MENTNRNLSISSVCMYSERCARNVPAPMRGTKSARRMGVCWLHQRRKCSRINCLCSYEFFSTHLPFNPGFVFHCLNLYPVDPFNSILSLNSMPTGITYVNKPISLYSRDITHLSRIWRSKSGVFFHNRSFLAAQHRKQR